MLLTPSVVSSLIGFGEKKSAKLMSIKVLRVPGMAGVSGMWALIEQMTRQGISAVPSHFPAAG